jgi:hypothetical protein
VRTSLFGILMLAAALPLNAGERLSIKVSPTIAFAPVTLIVRTTVEADAQNRAVAIVAQSADFFRSSEVELDGDQAPRTRTFEFRSLPPGSYEIAVALFGADGQERAVVRRTISVLATGAGQ